MLHFDKAKCDNGLIVGSAASFCAAMVAKHFQEYVSLRSLGAQMALAPSHGDRGVLIQNRYER